MGVGQWEKVCLGIQMQVQGAFESALLDVLDLETVMAELRANSFDRKCVPVVWIPARIKYLEI